MDVGRQRASAPVAPAQGVLRGGRQVADARRARRHDAVAVRGGLVRACGDGARRQDVLDSDRPAGHPDGGVRRRWQPGVGPQARHGRQGHRGDGQRGHGAVPVPGAVLRPRDRTGVQPLPLLRPKYGRVHIPGPDRSGWRNS